MEQALPHVDHVDFETDSINSQLEEKKRKEERSFRGKFDQFDEKMYKEAEKWKEKLEKGKGNLKKFEEKLKDHLRKYQDSD